jgi:membrane-bound lytic murein transglycosylase MltF
MELRKKISASVLLLSLVGNTSCQQEPESPGPIAADTVVISERDTSAFKFNEGNEFLGLGTVQFGDLDSMISRRRIRALVPYTHLYYWIDGKERRGIAFEALNLFEEALNKQLKFYPPKVRVIFIPVARHQVIPLLEAGYGDLGYAGLTITEERKKRVDFSTPSISGLREIVVGGPRSPTLHTLADLSGQEIFVHKESSYERLLIKLNDSLKRAGKKPIIIKAMDPYLESEDMLTLVNAGIIPFTATVEDVARLWSKVRDSLVLYDHIPLASNVEYGWVIRKNSPQLKASADKFIIKNSKGTLIGNMIYKKYVESSDLLPEMHAKKTRIQVDALKAIFQKYGTKYSLDWLLLIAQGYQESQLNQKCRSRAGAVGIMQVLPSTAKGSPIFIKNITTPDNNIHAGVKYMRWLADYYFNDPAIDTLNRHLLALAAYNCGPGRVSQLRKMTRAKGLNPNVWFNNVEIMAAKVIGRETPQYVSNIYKFYASYRALGAYLEKRGMTAVK